MQAELLFTGISQLVTPEGPGPKRGQAMRELRVIEQAALAVAQGRVVWLGAERDWQGVAEETYSLGRRAVVPGLVDPHTHAVWGGDRLNDFEARTSGVGYEAILAAGGGIWSTIRETAARSEEELIALARPRIAALLRSGATTIEVKSGYGFEPASELKMLRVIQALSITSEARILPTLLIHLPPKAQSERAGYLEHVCTELIPQVIEQSLAMAIDVFVEREAWSADEADRMLEAAEHNGLMAKLHTEQFHNVGGLALGLRRGVLSVDHLEACRAEQFSALAASQTVATLLPGVSLHLGLPAAPGRKLIDAGAAVAVGTDLNPGSSPLYSAAEALALSVRLNGLTVEEALVAGTVNAASAAGATAAGSIAVGQPADFLVLEGADWRELVYRLGGNPVSEVWVGGQKACQVQGAQKEKETV